MPVFDLWLSFGDYFPHFSPFVLQKHLKLYNVSFLNVATLSYKRSRCLTHRKGIARKGCLFQQQRQLHYSAEMSCLFERAQCNHKIMEIWCFDSCLSEHVELNKTFFFASFLSAFCELMLAGGTVFFLALKSNSNREIKCGEKKIKISRKICENEKKEYVGINWRVSRTKGSICWKEMFCVFCGRETVRNGDKCFVISFERDSLKPLKRLKF